MVADAGRPYRRLAILLACFAGLTAAGIAWAAPAGLGASLAQAAALPAGTLGLLGALAFAVIGAEMLRFRVLGRAVGAHIGFAASLDATIANNFMSWLTPTAALGEPAAMYMLARRGVPWDAAVLAGTIKFATSFIFILGLTAILIAAGFGPAFPPILVLSFAVAIGMAALFMVALLVGALWPERATAFVDRVERRAVRSPLGRMGGGRPIAAAAEVARRAIVRFARARPLGRRALVPILASHIVYYGAYAAVLVVLGDAFGARSALDMVPAAVIYQGSMYLVPTPGASGVGEASAAAFFGPLLPGGAAFVVVLLFRTSTFYFHVALGLVYLPLVGALRGVVGSGGSPGAGAA